jgi:putative molybdopterin biosynthesis protein
MEKLYTTQEVANMLGVSRITVFNKVKKGEIKARKVGRQYLIAESDLPGFLGGKLSKKDKSQVEEAVKKTVKEYGDTLKLLGQE